MSAGRAAALAESASNAAEVKRNILAKQASKSTDEGRLWGWSGWTWATRAGRYESYIPDHASVDVVNSHRQDMRYSGKRTSVGVMGQFWGLFSGVTGNICRLGAEGRRELARLWRVLATPADRSVGQPTLRRSDGDRDSCANRLHWGKSSVDRPICLPSGRKKGGGSLHDHMGAWHR